MVTTFDLILVSGYSAILMSCTDPGPMFGVNFAKNNLIVKWFDATELAALKLGSQTLIFY